MLENASIWYSVFSITSTSKCTSESRKLYDCFVWRGNCGVHKALVCAEWHYLQGKNCGAQSICPLKENRTFRNTESLFDSLR